MKLLSIDPGRCTGWALWYTSSLVPEGNLLSCGVGKPPQGVVNYSDTCLVEVPRVYPRDPVDPNDLIRLALRLGRLVQYVSHVPTRMVWPRDWKGTVEKGVHNARVLAALSPECLAAAKRDLANVPKSKRNNAVDAIGLGAWGVKNPGAGEEVPDV